jgi:hypothetical protein
VFFAIAFTVNGGMIPSMAVLAMGVICPHDPGIRT